MEATGSVPANGTRKIEISFEVAYSDLLDSAVGAGGLMFAYDFDVEMKFNQPTPFTLPLRQEGYVTLPTGPTQLPKK